MSEGSRKQAAALRAPSIVIHNSRPKIKDMAPKTSHSLSSFKYGAPLYGVAFPEGNTFYVCGGGGSSATGIKNRVVLAECLDGKLTDQIGEHNFGADCPMR
ncbi:hypothetical protein DUNSADRAFT_403 [Dunaliella salina]|uniref:Uncharacterized protein n=1 Tax=Dunaliella salina TaxID=3046 RepID=A0ABQ7FZ03_DUNSA|nr:hypothetical protein DUNSADRAFT_403 [Dunaliella salina]|eukprot:KAF5827589.1 hypothetical protein DUNSADRAFT_403 [Dunaliella salina]